MSFGPNPWQQTNWDARAAANFIAGGAGSGLIMITMMAGGPSWAYLIGAALVGLGLFAVWLEIGRPWRALNVLIHPRRSWMSREAYAAVLLFGAAAAAWAGWAGAPAVAAIAALGFVYCQGRILSAAKGIPAWREPLIVPLLIATALAEGAGLHLLVGGSPSMPWWGWLALALLARIVLWSAWRSRLRAAPRACAQIDRAGRLFKAATLLPLAAAVLAQLMPYSAIASPLLAGAAALLAVAGGAWFKLTLITRGAFNQGFSLPHLPVRGVRRPGSH